MLAVLNALRRLRLRWLLATRWRRLLPPGWRFVNHPIGLYRVLVSPTYRLWVQSGRRDFITRYWNPEPN